MTRTAKAAAAATASPDAPRYRIRLARSARQLEHRPDRTLLDTLEQQQVAVEYQCRSGFCGACRCRLLRGRVSYRQAPLAFLQPDEILPCCCIVQQDIEIDL
ncbi:class I ribonucleotide reductase maintenance protein YfaE [Edwardsiella piscicida]|uniref:Ferredoxin n=3 Tax=Edwardsiella TaxID=635 RepID=A0A0H3DUW3_EDWTF|nr:class I ribonucleotide reductase maintenance protein YfaE [Edwardsiella piscicida]ACY85175.1 ferredoxin-like protein [Edwardsiella tarda EIB202]ADM42218.1 Ferredoxin [Edwardsiella tarda FL6-60]ARD19404.1 ferredoxin [Edwardsiella piscicida]MDM3864254.1 class I ribonucleotide reductase maintenance protein YfaE [Edwardsiella piscicida]QBB13445.1 2Fe-2S ferredoxin-like protein [Edwardsiella piscicida]